MGTGDQSNRNTGILFRNHRPKGFAKPHPHHARFVEMQRICSGGPLAGFIKHEYARVRFFIRRGDLAPPGHIGLTDQKEEMKVFLPRKLRSPEERALNTKEAKN